MDPPENPISLERPEESSNTIAEPIALASLEGDASPPEISPTIPAYKQKKSPVSRLAIPFLILAILAVPTIIVLSIFSRTQRIAPAQDNAYSQQQVDLSSLDQTDTTARQKLQGKLAVNGQLSVSGSLQVSPDSKPLNPQSGQIYYDKTTNQLGYYNGSGFVYLQGGGNTTTNTTNATNVTNTSTTVVNNYSTSAPAAPPSVLLQGDTPGAVQTGNFNISGTGTLNIANVATGNITTVNAAEINGAVGNITTGNIDVGNINLVNTTQVDSGGDYFSVNKFEALPSGQSTNVGKDNILSTTDTTFNGATLTGQKVMIGSNGGPLHSISVYIGGSYLVAPTYSIQVGLYTDNGNSPSRPDTLMWGSDPIVASNVTFNSWLTVDLPYTIQLSPFTPYWIGINVAPASTQISGEWGFNPSKFNTKIQTNVGQQTICRRGGQTGLGLLSNFNQYLGGYVFLSSPDPGPCTLSNGSYSAYLNYTTDPSTGGAGAMFSISPTGQTSFRSTVDSPNAFKIQNAASATTIFNVDTYNMRVAIGKSSADYTLDVGGDLNLASSASLRFGGTAALSGNSTTTTVLGSTVAIQGGTFAVQNTTGTTNYLTVNTTTGATTLAGPTTASSTLGVAGATTLNGAAAVNNTLTNKITSTTAFQIQNASAANLLVADTTNKTITVGSASNNAALYVNRTIAAPANKTSGLSTAGASTQSGVNGYQYATKVTIGSVGGTLQSLSASLTGGVTTNQRQFAVYADNGATPSKPGALLATSTAAAITVNAVNTTTMPNITLNPYTTYWLAFNTNDSAVTRSYNTTASSNATCSVAATFGTMTDPFGAGCTLSDNIFNIYATYTPSTVSTASDSMFKVDSTGKTIFRNGTDSTAAFQIQTATDGQTLFGVDTTNSIVAVQSNNFKVQNTAGSTLLNVDTANSDVTVGSGNSTFAINQYATLPSGLPVTLGQTTVGPSSMNTGFSTVATKLTTGGSGGPLQSVSIYVLQSPVVYSLYGNWPLAAPVSLPLIVSFYADDGSYPDRPGSLIWTQTIDNANITPNSWLTVNTEHTPLQPNTPYWVSMRVPYNNNAPFYQLGATFTVGKVTKTTTNNTCSTGEGWTGTAADPFSSTACTLSNDMLNVSLNYTTDPSTGGAGAEFSLTSKGQAAFRNTEDSLNAFKIQDAASGSTVFNVDTFYRRVAIGKATADYKLDVNGDLNLASSSPLRFGGTAALVGNATSTTVMGTNVYVQGDTFSVQNTAGTTSYLSINTSTGATTLSGATTFSNTATVTGATTLNGATTVNNTLINKVTSPTAFQIQNASSANLFVADTTNMVITVKGTDTAYASLTLTDAHFKSTQTTAPTIATPTNCGTTPTAAVTTGSTDSAGSFTITTGTGGTSSTCDTAITFHKAYGAAPKSIIVVGKDAAIAAQRQIYVVSSTTTTFTVSFANSTGGVDNTAYSFNYWVIE